VQYGLGFFHELQLLAAAGHTVFFSNPRGSKGYGQEHCAAIRGRWGTADWEDIQTVLGFMRSHPRVDPARLGIMGGSYGGYMTNWAISHTRAFRAAITDRCVSNLVSMFGTSDYLERPDFYFPGNSWDRPDEMWRQSPLSHFAKVKTPTLIIHSEGDLRCGIEQAEQVHAALTLRGVPVRFVRYPRSTSHGMSRSGPPDLRVHRLREILAWWGRHLS
jgi:dipeptidyl aminopeptidase/acylaminoacyl peptidase